MQRINYIFVFDVYVICFAVDFFCGRAGMSGAGDDTLAAGQINCPAARKKQYSAGFFISLFLSVPGLCLYLQGVLLWLF
jgi:fructose-specific phosphotransferase system IIC component